MNVLLRLLVCVPVAMHVVALQCDLKALRLIARPVSPVSSDFIDLILPCMTQRDVHELYLRPRDELFYFGEDMQFGFDERNQPDNDFAVGNHIQFRYRIDAVLGRGRYGRVLKAWDFASQTHVAIKVAKDERDDTFKNEYRRLRKIHHESIIRPLDLFWFKSRSVIVYPLRRGSIDKLYYWTWTGLQQFTRNMVSALSCLESKKIVHCDLKPENILYDKPGSQEPIDRLVPGLKYEVADFGLATDEGLYDNSGTPFYLPPEIWRPSIIDRRGSQRYHNTDMFGLGMTLMSIVSKQAYNPKDYFAYVKQGRSVVLDHLKREISQYLRHGGQGTVDELNSFIRGCLDPNPTTRLTATKALSHPFIEFTQ